MKCYAATDWLLSGRGFRGRHERSDAELLAAHVAGDRYAFDQLFRRHHRQLHRLARLTSRTSEDADDALQDAMLSAHRGAGSFRYDAAVSSWLHRIVVNACLDRLRRAKAHPTAPLEDVYPVADRTAQVETAIAVQRALMRLPVEQRAAVVAVDMQAIRSPTPPGCWAWPRAPSRAAAPGRGPA